MRARRTTTAAAGALAVLVLAGCGGGDDDGRGATTDYRQRALSYLVGEYAGSCAPFPDGAASPGTVTLTDTGDLDAPGAAVPPRALLDEVLAFTFRRDLDATGPISIGLAVDDESPDGLTVELTTQQDRLVRVRQGPRDTRIGVTCTGVDAVADLLARPFLPLVADLLATDARPFRCTGPDGEATRDYAVDTTGASPGATLGDERFPFAERLERERLYVGSVAEVDRLVYEVRYLDGRSFAIQVDDRGDADYLLTRPRQDGAYTECVPA